MRIKLTQPGYENFTGIMGAVEFTDGHSDYGVSPQQAGGILGIVQGEMVPASSIEEPVVPPSE